MDTLFNSKGLWKTDRLVCKSGRLDTFIQNRPVVWSRTCADWYSYLIAAKWITVLSLIMSFFLISWTFFAFIWYALAFYNGDFLPEHLRPNSVHRPCLVNVGNSFLAFFLFSLETQHTIGYGYRNVNDECKAGVFLLMIQSASGALITIYVGGIVFNKLTRPKQTMKVLTFSERAVVAPRDGELCFMFKIANNIATQLMRPAIRVIFYKLQPTETGKTIPVESFDMPVHPSNTNLILLSPLVIEHKIDQTSPLYRMSPKQLYGSENNRSDAFEIVVIIEGTIQSTGDDCQYRTSYKAREILWGFRFKETKFTIENGKINFDMSTFEEFEPVNMNMSIDINREQNVSVSDPSVKKFHRNKKRKQNISQDNQSPVRVNA